jgi:hypothetical protein
VVEFTIGSRGKVPRNTCEKRIRRNNNNSNNNNRKLYTSLSVEIQRMWNMKCFVIPVITGATGNVTRGLINILKQYQESIQ